MKDHNGLLLSISLSLKYQRRIHLYPKTSQDRSMLRNRLLTNVLWRPMNWAGVGTNSLWKHYMFYGSWTGVLLFASFKQDTRMISPSHHVKQAMLLCERCKHNYRCSCSNLDLWSCFHWLTNLLVLQKSVIWVNTEVLLLFLAFTDDALNQHTVDYFHTLSALLYYLWKHVSTSNTYILKRFPFSFLTFSCNCVM